MGKRPLLDVAIRFADLISETFGPEDGKNHGYPGHQEVEVALMKLSGILSIHAEQNPIIFFQRLNPAKGNGFSLILKIIV